MVRNWWLGRRAYSLRPSSTFFPPLLSADSPDRFGGICMFPGPKKSCKGVF